MTSSGWKQRVWIPIVWVSTVAFHTAAFPPFDLPEAAYVFAVAAILWAARQPRMKTFLWTVGSATFVSWVVLLEWLHHVTIVGTVALSAIVSLFATAWFLAVWHATPRMRSLDGWGRVTIALGLAGLWVVLEWLRSWIFTGFPWLPLAASQWQRPIMLQSAAFGGAWAISFSLVLFNIGLAAYFERLLLYVKRRQSRWCPEFYLGLFVLFMGSFGLYRETIGQDRQLLFRAGFMQPYIPQNAKWDPAEARGILEIIQNETRLLNYLDPDVIFWPEAVMPVAVLGNAGMRSWTESLSRELETPIVLGGLAYEVLPDAGDEGIKERWSNAVFVVDPVRNLQSNFYAKRHLVPFGEYVPFRRFLPFIEKFVPIGGDFSPGREPTLLPLRTRDRTTSLGTLICYEDVFPALARSSARAGAQALFVATNNAWYGERGAAYQHAAHSVLRAVETRRPVLRAGNGGWSGWIDEYGQVRAVLLNDNGRVYFRGSSVHEIDMDRRWAGRQSFYVRFGNWLVWLSIAFVAGAVWMLRSAGRERW